MVRSARDGAGKRTESMQLLSRAICNQAHRMLRTETLAPGERKKHSTFAPRAGGFTACRGHGPQRTTAPHLLTWQVCTTSWRPSASVAAARSPLHTAPSNFRLHRLARAHAASARAAARAAGCRHAARAGTCVRAAAPQRVAGEAAFAPPNPRALCSPPAPPDCVQGPREVTCPSPVPVSPFFNSAP